MRALTVPRLWLAAVAAAIALSCLPVSVSLISRYRYAEWSITDRALLDSLLFAFPVITALSVITARIWLKDGLPWLSPNLPRSRSTAFRDTLAVSAAAVGGVLLGWLPVFVWGATTASHGHPSLIGLAGVLTWVAANVVITVTLTVTTRSIWPGVVLAFVWVVLFEYGRVTGQDSTAVPTTRLAMYPFDGIYLVTGAPLEQSPALSILKLAGGLITLAAGLIVLARVVGDSSVTIRQKVRSAVLQWSTLGAAAIVLGSMVSPVSVSADSRQPMRCINSEIRTCAYAAHTPDLQIASETATNLKKGMKNAFRASLVSEGAPRNSAIAPIVLYPEATNDPQADVALALSNYIIDPNGCYRKNPGPHYVVLVMLQNWLTAQATGSSPQTTGLGKQQAKQLQKWSKDPRATNAKLEAIWARVQRCDVKQDDLPS